MAHRRSSHSQETVDALNTISIIYADKPEVVKNWYEYFDILGQRPEVNWTQAGHSYLRLLSSMAKVLGYKNIDQVDLDRFYVPQGHIDEAEYQNKVQKELLRVLENSAKIHTLPKSEENK